MYLLQKDSEELENLKMGYAHNILQEVPVAGLLKLCELIEEDLHLDPGILKTSLVGNVCDKLVEWKKSKE